MENTKANPRTWSPLDQRADEYVHKVSVLDPIAATDWGFATDPAALPDLSPEGIAQRAQLDIDFLAQLEGLPLQDKTDELTAAAMKDRLSLSVELFENGEDYAELNNIASPLQGVRDAFSLMPTETKEDWRNIIARLKAVPEALLGYRQSLGYGASRNAVAARRQVEVGIQQARAIGTPNSPGAFFELLAAECPPKIAKQLGEGELQSAAATAGAAYLDLSAWLKSDLLPHAPAKDAVGRERYELFSALFVGARVDLDETYEWGLSELARITAEQEKIAANLFGRGTSVAKAVRLLEADPKYQIHGEENLLEWLQTTADFAVKELNGTQFEIDPAIARVDCRIAPSKEGGIWYTGPSADLSRPGQMWWSIPEGDTVFHSWQERTTVFHEGVPGHHLQIAQTILQKDSLNLWRRLGSWNSGHGEGWALYAEQLMADLGYQDDPANRLGMLDAQRLRAARVVLDIGVHLGKKRPGGTEAWDASFAWKYLRENAAGSDAMLRFELDRYLGWPGQAPSYKIGQRLWEELRDNYLAQNAATGSRNEVLRRFHTEALSVGSLPMATLAAAILD